MMRAGMGIATGLALMLAAPVAAQEASPVAAAPRYTMPSTATWDMPAASGELYRIFVSFPAGEAPEDGWPVLYVLDGNAMFAGFAEARRIQEWRGDGKMIVVGIGYPGDQAYDTRRMNDFTAAIPNPPPASQKKLVQYKSGARDAFLAFLTGTLRTEIGKRYKIDAARQSLFGHSLGGLFALHALYARPDAFHAIVAASPSLWWNDQAMLGEERAFTAKLAAGSIPKVSRLLVVAGDREESMVNVWESEALAKRLEPLSAYGLRTRSQIYAGEGHMTVPARAVTDTLRFVLNWP